MGNVVKFQAQGKEYPLSIMDHDGGKWVMAQQVGEAIGNHNIYALINSLEKEKEIIEGRHHSRATLDCSKGGRPRVLLSYRGVIRVAMRSQGRRAKLFRDWAEEVLYQVMTTGSYADPKAKQVLEAFENNELIPVDLAAERLRVIRLRTDEWSRRCLRSDIRALVARSKSMTGAKYGNWERYRRQDLTQAERALLLGISRDSLRRFEAGMRTIEQEHAIVDTQWRDFTRPPRRGELSLLKGGAR
jgi:prophage antirepressor-like protein